MNRDDKSTGAQSASSDEPRLLRLPEVLDRCGVSRTTLYEMVARGAFPPPVRISTRAVGWRSSDINAWMDNLPLVTDPDPGGNA